MAAFKDKKNGSWYVQFRYTDWRGERQQKLKRGFATKKEAQAWEREFLMQKQADVNMSFESFVALYEKDVKPKLKLNTWLSKEHIIRTKILPYFKKRKLSEITARDVIDWQNEIRQHTKSSGESYSPDYLKNVHLRKLLFAQGYRYRIADKSVPGHPDIFLRKYNTAVFVNGCFWHRHPGCKYAYTPKSRVEFWQKKFDDNVRRDSAVKAELLEHGIKCLIVWECTIKRMVKSSDVEKRIIQQCTGFLRAKEMLLEL